MANITVKNSITVTDNIVSVNFETDVANISKIELSKDGGNTFINSLNYSNNSASFDITDWENGTYTNCVLKLTFEPDKPVEPVEPGSSDLLDSTGAYVIDNFSGSSLDRSKWDYELGYVRNGELQNYRLKSKMH